MMHDKKHSGSIGRVFLEVPVLWLTIVRADMDSLLPSRHLSKPKECEEGTLILILQKRLLKLRKGEYLAWCQTHCRWQSYVGPGMSDPRTHDLARLIHCPMQGLSPSSILSRFLEIHMLCAKMPTSNCTALKILKCSDLELFSWHSY